ncbi:MAG: hypothetical protein DCC68_02955 [Planctomycetota bacterium]|nr:MAG: hypothetical protein DCC68_02955 [Planctomycetota bacterium]
MRSFFSGICVVAAAMLFSLSGCGDQPEKKFADATSGDHHDHASVGPHKGLLVELGNGEYHAEVCHDDATKKVTVYILDSKATNPVPIAEKEVKINLVMDGKPAQFVLPAMPFEGEMDGKSSRFELLDASLVEAHDAEGANARLKLDIAGTPYEGKIEPHDHGHDH